MVLRRVLVLQSLSVLQVAEGDAREKAKAEARAAKEKVTAREQQQQLQEFQVAQRKVSIMCCSRLSISISMRSLKRLILDRVGPSFHAILSKYSQFHKHLHACFVHAESMNT